MQRHTRGFSLAEVLVAMFVIVVGISGVTSAIYWGTAKADTGQNISQASNYARVLMETIVLKGLVKQETVNKGSNLPSAASGINDPPTARIPVFDPPSDFSALTNDFAISDSSGKRDRYRRNISTVRLAPANSTDALGGNHFANMFRVTVTVYWNDGGTADSEVTKFNRSVSLETVENI